MKPRRLSLYLAALLLLAWILGSLARSGTAGGGSLLSNSYWLVFAIELLPLAALGMMIFLIIALAWNWKDLSDSLGSGMSRKRRVARKKNRSLQVIAWAATWALAILVLETKCGGLFCNANRSAQAAAMTVQNIVSGGSPGSFPQLPILGPVVAIASLVDTSYVYIAFLGVLAVSSAIMVRAIKVSWDETRNSSRADLVLVQAQGREAVQDAIKVLEEKDSGDPRTRILLCYERMIKAASDLGAPVGPDRTARELENGIRGMFSLKGTGISKLTALFEEARYSLHTMSEEDSFKARDCLLEIQGELGKTVYLEA